MGEVLVLAADATQLDRVNAAPTKSFFVDMLVRDIELEQAILDLVDNCIDGVNRNYGQKFEGRNIRINLSSRRFRIVDDCGGFDKSLAKDYAFRFGRNPGTPGIPSSIGQFGVGMKRALFKFGRQFIVRSATTSDSWAIDVDVDDWEKDHDDWHFDWAEFGDTSETSRRKPGTDIVVNRLRREVASRFGTDQFVNEISGLLKSKHRQFIAAGLSISVNGMHLDAYDLYMLAGSRIRPGVEKFTFGESPDDIVSVRIVVGLGTSSPQTAGWNVICNGRVVLEHDTEDVTGWGTVERERIPRFHNQFARFRGIVSFDSRSAERLPWNTTKNDVNQDNPIWQQTLQRMIEMMRPVIDFLNELDKDINEFTRDESPLLDVVERTPSRKVETFVRKAEFRSPDRGSVKKVQRSVTIQYSKPVKDVEVLQKALSLRSATAVGQRTFDIVLKSHKSR